MRKTHNSPLNKTVCMCVCVAECVWWCVPAVVRCVMTHIPPERKSVSVWSGRQWCGGPSSYPAWPGPVRNVATITVLGLTLIDSAKGQYLQDKAIPVIS